ncbi:MAG TPA: queuosine precursor transporter [Terriglobales bacterium]|jgi:uncharacterized integral membrane protein (TIGR00697 family)|nr:queuosine precursor transporter [Terriglobales bacterium]
MRLSSLLNISATQRRLSSFRLYDLLVHVFVVILLISNIVAPKICAFGPFRLSGAQLLFPLTYIFGDIFTEVYGYAGSRRAIWLGFFSSALLALMSFIVVRLPPAPEFHSQAALATVLNPITRVLAASLIAFWGGEFVNSYVLAKMKLFTKGRWLWTRTVGSTVAGQAVDTILVIVVLFYGKYSWLLMGKLIVSGYLFKVTYEVLATPLTYWVVNSLKRAEGVDVYDRGTNFNPFGKEQVKESQEATA